MKCPLCSVPGTVWGTLNKLLNSILTTPLEAVFIVPFLLRRKVKVTVSSHLPKLIQLCLQPWCVWLQNPCLFFCYTAALVVSYLVLVHFGVNWVDSMCLIATSKFPCFGLNIRLLVIKIATIWLKISPNLYGDSREIPVHIP